jgi:hypothetical protein
LVNITGSSIARANITKSSIAKFDITKFDITGVNIAGANRARSHVIAVNVGKALSLYGWSSAWLEQGMAGAAHGWGGIKSFIQ